MKIRLLFTLAFLSIGAQLLAQLGTGSIAFVGFNADGDDDFAFVIFDSIPPSTNIIFCDSEWDGQQLGNDEGDFTWNSGANGISPGTIVSVLSVSQTINPSIGNITVNNAGGFSSGSEAIFAFQGTSPRTVSIMLAAISNSASGFGTLNNTGLIAGLTAIVLPEGVDIAEYKGARSGIDKNGYLKALNAASNWDTQDGSGDQSIDQIVPDLPWNSSVFAFSATDVTAPFIPMSASLSQTSTKIYFSEDVTNGSVTNVSNYSFSPAVSIDSVKYSSITNTAIVYHQAFTIGKAYTITVSNISDAANNTMSLSYISNAFYYNETAPTLVISEIMYNPPSSISDELEFIEIYNYGKNSIELGGLELSDEGGFKFAIPETSLAAGAILLFATDKDSADKYYGVPFVDLPPAFSNVFGNGGELLQIKNTAGTVICAVEYDDASPWPTSPDGFGPSLELLDPTININDGLNWIAATNLVTTIGGIQVLATPGSFSAVIIPAINFEESYARINENDGTLELSVVLSNVYDSVVTVDVDVIPNIGTALVGADFTFAKQTLTFPAKTAASIQLTIPIINNSSLKSDRFFGLELSNATNGFIGSAKESLIYILDTDFQVPVASNSIDVSYMNSYLVDSTGSAEIISYDAASQRMFVLNSTAIKVEILDFSDPMNVSSISSIDMSTEGTDATSVTTKNGIVAATVNVANFADGKVIFMDLDGNNRKVVTVGNLPDMVTFTPDGNYVLIANEGQPNDDYTIDPEGSISIIDVSGGLSSIDQSKVTMLTFNSFDKDSAALIAQGIRIFGPNASVSQDLEPEFITVSHDSKMAWVTLQENNAVGVIDLTTMTITKLIPLGTKDHSLVGNALDVSDKSDTIIFANYPIRGMYMPDAMANYTMNGKTYLVTANEGDSREYDTYEEEVKLTDGSYNLDPTVFKNFDIMKISEALGRINITNASGDKNNDGLFEEIHVFGSRSFSIWDATTGMILFDSGDDFERITANDPKYKSLFNASNSNNKYKNRSDNKGPEPEGITIGKVGEKVFVFITLERAGGLMVYDITDPANAMFVNYINNRDLGADEGGDLGPEGIIYLSGNESPIDTGLVIMANEVSATISIFKVANDVKVEEPIDTTDKEVSVVEVQNTNDFRVYPNPVSNDKVYFNMPAAISVFNISGVLIEEQNEAASLDVSNYDKGTYILKTQEGKITRIVIQ